MATESFKPGDLRGLERTVGDFRDACEIGQGRALDPLATMHGTCTWGDEFKAGGGLTKSVQLLGRDREEALDDIDPANIALIRDSFAAVKSRMGVVSGSQDQESRIITARMVAPIVRSMEHARLQLAVAGSFSGGLDSVEGEYEGYSPVFLATIEAILEGQYGPALRNELAGLAPLSDSFYDDFYYACFIHAVTPRAQGGLELDVMEDCSALFPIYEKSGQQYFRDYSVKSLCMANGTGYVPARFQHNAAVGGPPPLRFDIAAHRDADYDLVMSLRQHSGIGQSKHSKLFGACSKLSYLVAFKREEASRISVARFKQIASGVRPYNLQEITNLLNNPLLSLSRITKEECTNFLTVLANNYTAGNAQDKALLELCVLKFSPYLSGTREVTAKDLGDLVQVIAGDEHASPARVEFVKILIVQPAFGDFKFSDLELPTHPRSLPGTATDLHFRDMCPADDRIFELNNDALLLRIKGVNRGTVVVNPRPFHEAGLAGGLGAGRTFGQPTYLPLGSCRSGTYTEFLVKCMAEGAKRGDVDIIIQAWESLSGAEKDSDEAQAAMKGAFAAAMKFVVDHPEAALANRYAPLEELIEAVLGDPTAMGSGPYYKCFDVVREAISWGADQEEGSRVLDAVLAAYPINPVVANVVAARNRLFKALTVGNADGRRSARAEQHFIFKAFKVANTSSNGVYAGKLVKCISAGHEPWYFAPCYKNAFEVLLKTGRTTAAGEMLTLCGSEYRNGPMANVLDADRQSFIRAHSREFKDLYTYAADHGTSETVAWMHADVHAKMTAVDRGALQSAVEKKDLFLTGAGPLSYDVVFLDPATWTGAPSAAKTMLLQALADNDEDYQVADAGCIARGIRRLQRLESIIDALPADKQDDLFGDADVKVAYKEFIIREAQRALIDRGRSAGANAQDLPRFRKLAIFALEKGVNVEDRHDVYACVMALEVGVVVSTHNGIGAPAAGLNDDGARKFALRAIPCLAEQVADFKKMDNDYSVLAGGALLDSIAGKHFYHPTARDHVTNLRSRRPCTYAELNSANRKMILELRKKVLVVQSLVQLVGEASNHADGGLVRAEDCSKVLAAIVKCRQTPSDGEYTHPRGGSRPKVGLTSLLLRKFADRFTAGAPWTTATGHQKGAVLSRMVCGVADPRVPLMLGTPANVDSRMDSQVDAKALTALGLMAVDPACITELKGLGCAISWGDFLETAPGVIATRLVDCERAEVAERIQDVQRAYANPEGISAAQRKTHMKLLIRELGVDLHNEAAKTTIRGLILSYLTAAARRGETETVQIFLYTGIGATGSRLGNSTGGYFAEFGGVTNDSIAAILKHGRSRKTLLKAIIKDHNENKTRLFDISFLKLKIPAAAGSMRMRSAFVERDIKEVYLDLCSLAGSGDTYADRLCQAMYANYTEPRGVKPYGNMYVESGKVYVACPQNPEKEEQAGKPVFPCLGGFGGQAWLTSLQALPRYRPRTFNKKTTVAAVGVVGVGAILYLGLPAAAAAGGTVTAKAGAGWWPSVSGWMPSLKTVLGLGAATALGANQRRIRDRLGV